jgi:prepilin peptidase CpaA
VNLDPLLLLFFPAIMAFAAFSDMFTMTIPNRVSLILIAGFVAMAIFTGMPLKTFALHIGAGVATLLVTFALFACGWVGGGDAKLAAATGLWCGFGALMDYLFTASLLGGLLTLGILGLRASVPTFVTMRIGWLSRLHEPKCGIPYGIALAAAGLIVYPQTEIWRAVALG